MRGSTSSWPEKGNTERMSSHPGHITAVITVLLCPVYTRLISLCFSFVVDVCTVLCLKRANIVSGENLKSTST